MLAGDCSINVLGPRHGRHSPFGARSVLTKGFNQLLKMRLFIVLSLLCVVGVTLAKPSTYTDKWDYINVDEILESQRLLKGYVDCLMDRGRCTADGKTLKETMPDALEHECNKCTPKQKEGADKVIRHLVNKRPELWKELSSKYDPNNIYQQRYKDKIDAVKN